MATRTPLLAWSIRIKKRKKTLQVAAGEVLWYTCHESARHVVLYISCSFHIINVYLPPSTSISGDQGSERRTRTWTGGGGPPGVETSTATVCPTVGSSPGLATHRPSPTDERTRTEGQRQGSRPKDLSKTWSRAEGRSQESQGLMKPSQ